MKAMLFAVMALLFTSSALGAKYVLSYEDVTTGAEIPKFDVWPIKHGDCKDAYKASASATPAPTSASGPAIVTSPEGAAIALAGMTLGLLAETAKKAEAERDEAEFLEACLLVKGIRTVRTPV